MPQPKSKLAPPTELLSQFFYGLDPLLAYNLKLALALRQPLIARALPAALYPTVLLLACVSEERILDDLDMLRGLITTEHGFNGGLHMWHPQYFLVSAVVFNGLPPDSLRDHRDTLYIGEVLSYLRSDEMKTWAEGVRGGLKKYVLEDDHPDYRDTECPNCGRHRVEWDGVCEKCGWDVDGGNYSSITRPKPEPEE